MTDKINTYKDIKSQFITGITAIDSVNKDAAEKLYNDMKNKSKKKRYLPGNLPMLNGNNRNIKCPCGSGKKFKNCCGRIK
jgi:uncharacterized protein YecA (UPF0149 family)